MRFIKIDLVLCIPIVVFLIILGGYLLYTGYRKWSDNFNQESKDLWAGYYDELEQKKEDKK